MISSIVHVLFYCSGCLLMEVTHISYWYLYEVWTTSLISSLTYLRTTDEDLYERLSST